MEGSNLDINKFYSQFSKKRMNEFSLNKKYSKAKAPVTLSPFLSRIATDLPIVAFPGKPYFIRGIVRRDPS